MKDKFYDIKNRPIRPGDLIRVTNPHWIKGVGFDKYMYKLVYRSGNFLRAAHISDIVKKGMGLRNSYDLRSWCTTNVNGISFAKDTEIIEGFEGQYFKARPKYKVTPKSRK